MHATYESLQLSGDTAHLRPMLRLHFMKEKQLAISARERLAYKITLIGFDDELTTLSMP